MSRLHCTQTWSKKCLARQPDPNKLWRRSPFMTCLIFVAQDDFFFMANPKYLPTGSDWVITRGICYYLVRGGHCRSLKIPTLFEAGIVRLLWAGCWGTKTKEDSSHADDFFVPARLVQMFCCSADESQVYQYTYQHLEPVLVPRDAWAWDRVRSIAEDFLPKYRVFIS